MKISMENLKQAPPKMIDGFGVCVYGPLPDDVREWIKHHGFEFNELGGYTNIKVDRDPYDVFLFTGAEGLVEPKYEYMDGFSPNLNKRLHVGHMSNLVYAKAFGKMGLARMSVAILGDTLEGDVSKEDALEKFHKLIAAAGYTVDMVLFASAMKLNDESMLVPGEGEYEGTRVFRISTPYSRKFGDVPDDLIVGVKSDGSTTYFYQDVALAQKLGGASTLYLTGSEQEEHFESLGQMFPNAHHTGLGLVKASGKKMASRLGNVIYLDDVMEMLAETFGCWDLAYNVMAGYILKTAPHAEKNIDLDTVSNPKLSPGLYLSYTMARLKSAGVNMNAAGRFDSRSLQFAFMKARSAEMPNWFFTELVSHAKAINGLYVTHQIRGNAENAEMFGSMGSDLLRGMLKMGMLEVDKVPQRWKCSYGEKSCECDTDEKKSKCDLGYFGSM